MKILFITNIPSPYRIDFFNELGKGNELKVIFEAEKAPNINNKWYSNNSIKNFEAIFLKKGEIAERKIDWKILKHIKKNNYDVIVVTSYAYFTEMLALIYLKLRNIPYFLEVDGGIIRNENKFKKALKTFLISKAHGYISPSKKTDEYLIHYGADNKKIYRYPFTSLKQEDILEQPITKNEKLEIRKGLGLKEEKIVLSVGQFIYRKGYDVLLKAAKNIDKNVGIYIVGGEPTEEYIKIKEQLQLKNVHFVGFKSKDELKKYYKAADLFVLPTREDIWGLVINEAMAYGLPVITTDNCVAGLELIRNSENGFIVPVENTKELVEKINYILSSKNIETICINTLIKIKKYNITNSVETHKKIFRYNKKELNINEKK